MTCLECGVITQYVYPADLSRARAWGRYLKPAKAQAIEEL